MAVDEQRRHRLYEAVREALGDTEAATLMEYLPPVGWADVATRHDLAELEARLDLRFDALRSELRAEISGVRSDLHCEIGGVHDALREQTTRLVTWMIPTLISVVAMSLAVARLA